jgi:hypothetical protein
MLSYESLDDTQTTQRLVELCQQVTPLILYRCRLSFQLTTHSTHNPTGDRGNDEYEERQLPTHGNHRGKANDDGDGLTDEHIDTAGDRVLHSTHV